MGRYTTQKTVTVDHKRLTAFDILIGTGLSSQYEDLYLHHPLFGDVHVSNDGWYVMLPDFKNGLRLEVTSQKAHLLALHLNDALADQ